MSFDWGEYLNLAEDLVKDNSEAKLRSAISRAYYAVFCLARNYLRDVKNKPMGGRVNVHNLVVETLKSDPSTKVIGEDLRRLRLDRNKADYEDTFPDLKKQAVVDVKLAQDIYNKLLILAIKNKN